MSNIDWNTATLAEMKRELARCYTLDGRGVPAPCPDCGGESGVSGELCPVHAAEAAAQRQARDLERDRARVRELYAAAGRPVPEWAR